MQENVYFILFLRAPTEIYERSIYILCKHKTSYYTVTMRSKAFSIKVLYELHECSNYIVFLLFG